MGIAQVVTRASVTVLLVVGTAHAANEADPARLAQAKEQFRLGVALLNAGDTEGALVDFQHSRALLPSGRNTVNAAICLERLGRYDEALDLYEVVLNSFASELDEEDRGNLGPVMDSLRAKLSYVELSANVTGDVVIADRLRGQLPFSAALRVLPGKTAIRVSKAGYRPYESTVQLVAGQTLQLVLRLEPLNPATAPAPRLAPAPSTVVDPPLGQPASGNVRRQLAWTLSAAGVAQLGIAGYFGVRAFQLHDDHRDADAGQAADISTVLALTGLATSAAGVYLFVTSSKPRNAALPAPGVLRVALGASAIEVSGSF